MVAALRGIAQTLREQSRNLSSGGRRQWSWVHWRQDLISLLNIEKSTSLVLTLKEPESKKRDRDVVKLKWRCRYKSNPLQAWKRFSGKRDKWWPWWGLAFSV